MTEKKLKLLDCTLRDGGYINDWRWGYNRAREVISSLIMSGVDIVEVGFLRDVEGYDPDVTVCDRIAGLNKLLPDDPHYEGMFAAMAMQSDYDITKLTPYDGTGIEMIRVTAHDHDLSEGLGFAKAVKDRGYKLSINPINIMGYRDDEILWILDQVNEIQPYQFSIVDTFGSMKRRDLDRIVSLVDHNLDRSIRVALHLHENMSLSCSLAQRFIDKDLKRPVTIDASLMGMGRIPGNLPIELIADYLNDHCDKAYDIDHMMDAIQEHIAPLKGDARWGYTPAYFLSARFNLHRNYAEYYLKKGDLTNRDINHILAGIERKKATVFDAGYADVLYDRYKDNMIDDTSAMNALEKRLSGRSILLLAPGPSIVTYKELVDRYILDMHPLIISVNFVPEMYQVDLGFFSNSRRYARCARAQCDLILTSDLPVTQTAYRIDHNRLANAFAQGADSYIMLLKLLKDLHIRTVTVAGADGYLPDVPQYYKETMRSTSQKDIGYNVAIAEAVKRLGVQVTYLTPSVYS